MLCFRCLLYQCLCQILADTLHCCIRWMSCSRAGVRVSNHIGRRAVFRCSSNCESSFSLRLVRVREVSPSFTVSSTVWSPTLRIVRFIDCPPATRYSSEECVTGAESPERKLLLLKL